jgi:hypothetical protein
MVTGNMNRTLPNLFIAGAPKSGSSFLYENLAQVPDVFVPEIKELNYFSYDEILALPSYYKSYLVNTEVNYLKHFKAAKNERYLLDSSVSYFTFDTVPEKIWQFNPNSKFIFIVRNPIKRAHSHYLMDVRMGVAPQSFEDSLDQHKPFPAHRHQYIENSLYFKHISRFIEHFGNENCHILVLETLREDLVHLFHFLGIDPEKFPIQTEKKVNENKTPRNKWVQQLHGNRVLTTRLKKIIPKFIVTRLNTFLYTPAAPQQIDPTTENQLKNLFYEDTVALGNLLNRDLLSLWKMNNGTDN